MGWHLTGDFCDLSLLKQGVKTFKKIKFKTTFLKMYKKFFKFSKVWFFFKIFKKVFKN
jgi:hypothetical protein